MVGGSNGWRPGPYRPPHRRKANPLDRKIPGVLKRPGPLVRPCPNTPDCGHLGLAHDVEDMDGSGATCTVDGCTCGLKPGSSAFIRAELVAILDGCPDPHDGEWPFVRETCLVPHILEWAHRWAAYLKEKGVALSESEPEGDDHGNPGLD